MPKHHCKSKCKCVCFFEPPIIPPFPPVSNTNLERLLAIYQAFQNGDPTPFLNALAPNFVLTYHGDSARVGPVPIIPFAGSFVGVAGVQQYLQKLTQSLITISQSSPSNIQANSDFTQITINVTDVVQPRCGTVLGPVLTLKSVIQTGFNAQGQIISTDIYEDTSALAIFYNSNCPPL